MKPLVEAIRARDLAALRRAVASELPRAQHPQIVLEAARTAWTPGLRVLLDAGADPNASWRGYRPVHALIQEGPHAAAAAAGAGKQPRGARQRAAALDLLLDRGADPQAIGAWPPARAVVLAAYWGAWDCLEPMVRHGARDDGYVACARSEAEAARRALAADATWARRSDAGGLSPLHCTALSRGAAVDPARADASIEIARALLEAGAEVRAVAPSWNHEIDVIYCAASARNMPLFRWLLEHGADATSALISGLWNATLEFAAIALEHGAEPDRAEHEGKPLLNQLVRWGQVQPALWLIERGADPNRTDERGWTAVHQAASRGNARMLSALLEAGGDGQRPDAQGLTPRDVAASCGRAALLPLFQRAPRKGPRVP